MGIIVSCPKGLQNYHFKEKLIDPRETVGDYVLL